MVGRERGDHSVPSSESGFSYKEEAKNGYRDRLLASFDTTIDTGNLLTFRTFMSDSA